MKIKRSWITLVIALLVGGTTLQSCAVFKKKDCGCPNRM